MKEFVAYQFGLLHLTAILPSLAAGALILVLGVISLWLQSPWLFPSLGPTLMLMVMHPEQETSRPKRALAGHLVGLGAGIVAARGCGVAGSALSEGFTAPHAVAAAIAMSLTLWGGRALRAEHPPAAATTLLIALGALHGDADGVIAFGAGLGVVCVGGGWLRGALLWQNSCARGG